MNKEDNMLCQWKCSLCGYTKWVNLQRWLDMWCRNLECPAPKKGILSKMARTGLKGYDGCLTVFNESDEKEGE